MVIDFRSDSAHAARHDVLDAHTGQGLNHLHIVRADDEAGEFLHYPMRGDLYEIDPGTGRPALALVRWPIRIAERPAWRRS